MKILPYGRRGRKGNQERHTANAEKLNEALYDGGISFCGKPPPERPRRPYRATVEG